MPFYAAKSMPKRRNLNIKLFHLVMFLDQVREGSLHILLCINAQFSVNIFLFLAAKCNKPLIHHSHRWLGFREMP